MTDLSKTIEAIKSGNPGSIAGLESRLDAGLRMLYLRRMPGGARNAGAYVKQAVSIAIERIRTGSVQSAEDLLAFLRSTLPAPDPGGWERGPSGKVSRAVKRVLHDSVDDLEWQVLHRYYVLEKPESQICLEMEITEDELRSLKDRVRAMVRAARLKPAKIKTASLVETV